MKLQVFCDEYSKIFFFLGWIQFNHLITLLVHGGRVVRCRTCDREVVGSIPTRGCVHQRQLSVPSHRDRLMSTSKSWGVNGHTTWCTSPVSMVWRHRLVSGWGLRKRRSAPPHGPLRLGKGLYLHPSQCSCCNSPIILDRQIWTVESRKRGYRGCFSSYMQWQLSCMLFDGGLATVYDVKQKQKHINDNFKTMTVIFNTKNYLYFLGVSFQQNILQASYLRLTF